MLLWRRPQLACVGDTLPDPKRGPSPNSQVRPHPQIPMATSMQHPSYKTPSAFKVAGQRTRPPTNICTFSRLFLKVKWHRVVMKFLPQGERGKEF